MPRRLLSLLFIMAFGHGLFGLQILHAQNIGQTAITLSDPARGNRQVTAEVYYPASSSGQNAPIQAGAYPLIVYGHGFVMVWSAYQNVWTDLVPQGYIVAFPTTEGSFSPIHANFGGDLAFLVTAIQAGEAAPRVPAANVAATSAIMGHSMGGGSSFLGAAGNSNITAMVTFAAANTTPSSIAVAPQVTVPTLLFSGANDCVTPPAQHQDLMYNATAATHKTQISINGGGHCFFANNNLNCSFGESTCTPTPTITRAQQQSTVSLFLSAWLARFLKNDCSQGERFQDSLLSHSGITFRQSRSIACATSVDEIGLTRPRPMVYPNPFNSTIAVDQAVEGSIYSLCDLGGRMLWTGTELSRQDLSYLSPGCYLLHIQTPGCRFTRKILKQ
ncbi:MAG: T9SS type A sorting domain-containing protein [Sphingomonadales bacterium]|nr:T9SS type A sorting domain-containing protein [Sphingomonadales bacterium]